MTDTERDLLRAVCETPDDDEPRLVYADWCDENWQGERAEFIRVQIALAAMECRDGEGVAYWANEGIRKAYRTTEAIDLKLREEKLWGYLPRRDGVLTRLPTSIPGTAVILDSDNGSGLTRDYPWVHARRGFPDHVTLTLSQFMGGPCGSSVNESHGLSGDCPHCHGTGTIPGLARELFEKWPITGVRLSDREPLSHGAWFWEIPDTASLDGRIYDLNHPNVAPRVLTDAAKWTNTRFKSPEAAHAALSHACVSLIRTRAGLPAIPSPS